MELNGISVEKAILASHDDCHDIHTYCRKYVQRMDIDAEGLFVEMGLLLSCLNCSGNLVLLDRNSHVELKYFRTKPVESSSEPVTTIELLFRPGHYDLLYRANHFPELVSGDEDGKLAINEEKAGKILLPSEFELYKSLVSIGIKAPEDELYRLARFAFYQVPLDDIVERYLQSEFAREYLDRSDPDGLSAQSVRQQGCY